MGSSFFITGKKIKGLGFFYKEPYIGSSIGFIEV